MTTRASAPYREHWDPVNHRGLCELRDMYWGARGRAALKNVLARPPLERFLHFRQPAVQDLFDLSLPDGLHFVREEYLLLADRLCNARKQKAVYDMHGCLLLGQQGVGKSHFLLLLLVQCLSREETVLFTSSHGDTYLFDEDGIVRTRTADFSSSTHLFHGIPEPPERLWSLVDCSQANGTIFSSVTYASRQLFFVAAARPDLSHCGDLKRRFNIREWWMSEWTENELRALIASIPHDQIPPAQPGRYPLSSPNTARSLIQDVGSSPQDILLYLTAPDRYEELVNDALLHYTSVDAIYRLLSGLDLRINPDAHKLVLISREGPVPVAPNALDTDDRAIAHFKTRAIHSRVLTSVMALSVEDTEHLYAAFRASDGPSHGGVGPFAAASSALLFENMALRYARDEDKLQKPLFAPFRDPYVLIHQHKDPAPDPHRRVHMTRAQTSASSSATVRFLYQSKNECSWRTTVAVSSRAESHSVVWRPSRGAERDGCGRWLSDVYQCTKLQDNLPDAMHTWPSVAALCAAVRSGPWDWDVGGAFCRAPDSDSGHDALFDAYALHVDRSEDSIWAIRVATPGQECNCGATAGGEGGFAAIAQLKEALREGFHNEERPVHVWYVLIVPYGEPEFGVEWSLPAAGFEEHPGGVYVQFLDVSAFGGDVADVFGVPRPDVDEDADGAPDAGTAWRVMSKTAGKRKRDEGRY